MTPSTILTPLPGHAYVFDFQSSRLMFGYDISFELMMILFILPSNTRHTMEHVLF